MCRGDAEASTCLQEEAQQQQIEPNFAPVSVQMTEQPDICRFKKSACENNTFSPLFKATCEDSLFKLPAKSDAPLEKSIAGSECRAKKWLSV